jgi:hypothetical protein
MVIKLAVIHSNGEVVLNHNPVATISLEFLNWLVELDVTDRTWGHDKIAQDYGMEYRLCEIMFSESSSWLIDWARAHNLCDGVML